VPWSLTDDVERYAERVRPLLTRSPAEHTIALTVMEAVRGGHRWSDAPMLFGWFEEGGEVRGAVSMTPPYELLLAAVPEDTVDALVATLRAEHGALPGVNGDVATVEPFVAAWTAGTRLATTTAMRLQLYELGTLSPPDPPPPGRARTAEPADLELARRWLSAFRAETQSGAEEREAMTRARIEEGRLWLWEDAAGEPVALASRTPATAGVARVAPVYTPPEQRRRGYGAAVTGAVTATAIEAGADRVVLFTDVTNPTTNAIYQRIGYRPLGAGQVVVRFEGAR
jgi:predicted GNAT family acetyltransferase